MLKTILTLSLTLAVTTSMARDESKSPTIASPGKKSSASTSAAPEGGFNFAKWLSHSPGTLYKNPDNPWLQEFQISGRFHYNAAYVDGRDNEGRDFHDGYSDFRRFRLGAKATVAKYFTLYGIPNLVKDSRDNASVIPKSRDLDWGFQDFDELWVRFDVKGAFDVDALDKLTLQYGVLKWHGGQEARESSNRLLTPERSAISNYVYDSGARPTGLWINGAKDKWNILLGIYSSDGRAVDLDQGDSYENRFNNRYFSSWNDDFMYTAEVLYNANKDLHLGWEFLYNNADKAENHQAGGKDNLIPYQWASTFSAEYTRGNAGIVGELFAGDNGEDPNPMREGLFYGVVLTPYYWVVPKKVQAVVQYMYFGSEGEQGVRTNSRYFRAVHDPDINGSPGIDRGRGDALHTCYAGINYLVADHNLKFQFGAEYTSLNTVGGEASGITLLFATRFSF